MTKPHTIMLSKQAIGALKQLKLYTGHSEYLFTGRLASKPVSDKAISNAYDAVFDDYHIVPHGCRHFFSTQANESGLFRKESIDSFLQHKDKNEISAIYNQATYDSERKQLAQWWSDQLDIARDSAKVLPFNQA
jgi:integrase|tara:strand:- start:32784 stop:33185 length:402 start_codon:yes stop_codon:yes gene_type:complete